MSGAFEEIAAALVARTGHHYYNDKPHLLEERLRQRQEALGLGSLDAYAGVLAGESRHDSEAEWRELEHATTIGETYFFRYADHFAALRETILPDLIARRASDRSLRIWSIGCANGAEPYSVAILVREILGDAFDDWRVSITGGDLSERALDAARRAHYNAWSLRAVSEAERALYFDRLDQRTWSLKRRYRFVRFERQNVLDLLSDAPPLSWSGFDLILCRNVLIYFSPAQALALTRALKARTNEGGTLILGHAEASLDLDEVLSPLRSEFEQVAAPLAEMLAPQVLTPAPWTPAPLPDVPQRARAEVAAVTQESPEGVSLAAVRAAADAGDYEHAHALSKVLIAKAPLSAEAHYYDALISLVTDGADEAETALRRALYLDRGFALAHHRLALLLLTRARRDEARRALQAAIELARRMPADAPLPEGEGVTAGVFAEAALHQLGALDAAA